MKSLPIVMLADRRKLAFDLNEKFPNRLGLLLGPNGWKNPRGLPYAIDNGRFSVWLKKQEWDGDLYQQILNLADGLEYPPLFAIVPDVVADARTTFREWNKWHVTLKDRNWDLALAVQDGMTVEQVKKLRPRPDDLTGYS